MRVARGAAALAAGVALVVLVTQLGVTVMRTEGSSMEHSLEPGAMVLVVRPFALRTAGWLRGATWSWLPRFGAVVAVKDPATASSGGGATTGRLLVKRVVAVGPATVALVDGQLLVDGSPRSEPWLDPDLRGAVRLPERTVTEGEVFVLGDNRLPLASRDSRNFGPLPVASLRGQLVAALQWPWNRADGWRWPLRAV